MEFCLLAINNIIFDIFHLVFKGENKNSIFNITEIDYENNHLVIENTQFIFEYTWPYKFHKDEQLQNISNFLFKTNVWATKVLFTGKTGNWHLVHELGNELHRHRNMAAYI